MMAYHARVLSAIFGVLAALSITTCAQQQSKNSALATQPWMNTSLPIPQRVDHLVRQMTLEEKVQQMRDHAPAIPRLGVPKYDW